MKLVVSGKGCLVSKNTCTNIREAPGSGPSSIRQCREWLRRVYCSGLPNTSVHHTDFSRNGVNASLPLWWRRRLIELLPGSLTGYSSSWGFSAAGLLDLISFIVREPLLTKRTTPYSIACSVLQGCVKELIRKAAPPYGQLS